MNYIQDMWGFVSNLAKDVYLEGDKKALGFGAAAGCTIGAPLGVGTSVAILYGASATGALTTCGPIVGAYTGSVGGGCCVASVGTCSGATACSVFDKFKNAKEGTNNSRQSDSRPQQDGPRVSSLVGLVLTQQPTRSGPSDSNFQSDSSQGLIFAVTMEQEEIWNNGERVVQQSGQQSISDVRQQLSALLTNPGADNHMRIVGEVSYADTNNDPAVLPLSADSVPMGY